MAVSTLCPFRVSLYNKSLQRVGILGNPQSLTATPRWNQIPTASIVLPLGHRAVSHLNPLQGDRVKIEYTADPEPRSGPAVWETLLTGRVKSYDIAGPTVTGTYTAEIEGDLGLIWRMFGWPVPAETNPYGTQGVKSDKRTGPAETVAKGFISANAHNMKEAITVATDLGRGSTITAESRMAILGEAFMDLVDKAGIGLTVTQGASSLVVDAKVPSVYPRILAEDSGVVIGYTASGSAPTATRTIVGGPNADTSRQFRQVIDTDLEDQLGYAINIFTDAASVEEGDTDAMDQQGHDTLTANAAKSGFSLTLGETSVFRYGGPNGLHVGDQITVRVGSNTFTDVLREATLTYTREDGLKVTPTVGERTDDPDKKLAAFLSGLAAAVRKSQRR